MRSAAHAAAREPLSEHPQLPSQTGQERGAVSTGLALLLKDTGRHLASTWLLPPPSAATGWVLLGSLVQAPERSGAGAAAGAEEPGGPGREGQRDRFFAQAAAPRQTDRLGTPSSVHLPKLPSSSEPRRRPRPPAILRGSPRPAPRPESCPASVGGGLGWRNRPEHRPFAPRVIVSGCSYPFSPPNCANPPFLGWVFPLLKRVLLPLHLCDVKFR